METSADFSRPGATLRPSLLPRSSLSSVRISIGQRLFISVLLAILGVVNDPTTSGWSDSEQAMHYETPKED